MIHTYTLKNGSEYEKYTINEIQNRREVLVEERVLKQTNDTLWHKTTFYNQKLEITTVGNLRAPRLKIIKNIMQL